MNRRAMMHLVESLQEQLHQAVTRAEAAEAEVRHVEGLNDLLRRERDSLREEMRRSTSSPGRQGHAAPLPAEVPATPVAEEVA